MLFTRVDFTNRMFYGRQLWNTRCEYIFFWLLNSVMQKNNIFLWISVGSMYINIFSYTNTNIYLNSHWDCFSLFYFFYWFMNGYLFFLNMCTILGNLFLELQQSNNLKKIISDILKAFTCMNKNITSIIHVWNDKRTGHIYVPLPYLTHPPFSRKKPLSYPIQMKPTNIKQYCQPIFIRDDSISIKLCVTEFFFSRSLIINTRFV